MGVNCFLLTPGRRYLGILGVLCCWCVVCCPCDSRQVYNAPDGKKVLASGTPSGQFVEMC